MDDLKKSILKTIIYFDIFDYPLTLLEIWKWLYLPDKQYTLAEVQEELDKQHQELETKYGFYFLSGREQIVATRLERYTYAIGKYNRAIKFIKIFRFVPFIKMISVCNSLAYSNCSKEGDIDLFIIAEPNRLWLTRLFVVGWLKLLGVRPTVSSKQDALDAHFFLAETKLNLADYDFNEDDIRYFHYYWVNQMVPIFNPFGLYEKFQTANLWIKKILPNCYNYEINAKRQVGLNWFVKIKRFGLKLIFNYDFWESFAKKIQLKIMPADLKQLMNKDSRVVVNENILKFHREDRRQEYLNKYQEKLTKYGIY